MKILESLVEKLAGKQRVDYFDMDLKEYALKFNIIYEEFKVCDADKKTELIIQLFDLLNAWSDKNIDDKNFTYATIIVSADDFKVKALEELMQKAEGQIAEDENYVDWFKEEAEKVIALKRQKGDSILDIGKIKK
jgi:hypothetical protein